jgi:hypothetical protein
VPVPVWYPPPLPDVIVVTERVEVPVPYPVPGPVMIPPPPYAPPLGEGAEAVLGAEIWAADGAFLGVISFDPTDPYSISNPDGRFGHSGSPESIWNYDGRFGSTEHDLSPWCDTASRPPQLILNGRFRGYLTTNERAYPRVDPYWLADYLGLSS